MQKDKFLYKRKRIYKRPKRDVFFEKRTLNQGSFFLPSKTGIMTYSEVENSIRCAEIKIRPFKLKCLGPASYDLHLGSKFRFLNINQAVDLSKPIDFSILGEAIQTKTIITINPGQLVLGVTEEKISLSSDVCAWIEGKSTLSRLGLMIHTGSSFNHPGTNAHIVLELYNTGPFSLKLQPGIAIGQIIFEKCLGKAEYRGRFFQQKGP